MMIAPKIETQKVDLHLHSTASDGSWTPAELVQVALEQGINYISLTDHDTIANLPMAEAQANLHGLGFVPGVEITVDWKGTVYHLLMYAFDPHNLALNEMLADTQLRLKQRKWVILKALRKMGYKLPWVNSNSTCQPELELAKALVASGEIATLEEARDLCREVAPQERVSQPAEYALKVGLAAGAIPVIAHPGRSGREVTAATPEVLKELVELGLAGVEAYYHNHTSEMTEQLVEFAQEHDLLVTCGSDSHDAKRKPIAWSAERCHAFLELIEERMQQKKSAA